MTHDEVNGPAWGAEACRLTLDALEGRLDTSRGLSTGAAYASIQMLAVALRSLAALTGDRSQDEIEATARRVLEELLASYLLLTAEPPADMGDDDLPA